MYLTQVAYKKCCKSDTVQKVVVLPIPVDLILEQSLVTKILFFFVFVVCHKHWLSILFVNTHFTDHSFSWAWTSQIIKYLPCNTKSYLRRWILLK